jgi:hypothetical protein
MGRGIAAMRRFIGFTLALVALFATPRSWSDEKPSFTTAAKLASWCEPYRKAVLNGNEITVQDIPESAQCYGVFMAVQQFGHTLNR